ncbi:hypothetical protein CKO22_07025 [Thiococcus pfennigii]|nr:hypothetical protein [Thiococcus pfennigii]
MGMRERVNPTLIGAFVIGAVALALILVILLGGGTLFQQSRHFVVVFDQSLHGLSVGAPVAFRGVPIGQVTSINPVIDADGGKLRAVNMIVDIEINRGQIRSAKTSLVDMESYNDDELADFFDQQGVRAQLALQSLLTGQLFVNLDFFPDSPVKKVEVTTNHPQIATIETGLQRLGRTIDTLPIDQIIEKFTNVLDGLDRVINAEEIPRILAAAQGTAESSERIATGIEQQLDPIMTDLRGAAAAANQALGQARDTLDLEDGPAGELLRNLTRAAETAEGTLAEARTALAQVDHLLGDHSPERQRIQAMLGELTSAARSFRVLADYLERHPEALIQGKRR